MTRPSTKRKNHPLSMRLPEADLAVIDRAAALRGRSRTEFVRDAAVRAAEETLVESAVLRMSASSFASFVAALAEPGRAVPELVEVFRRSPPSEAEGGAV